MHRSLPYAVWAAAQVAGAVLCIVACSRDDEAGRAARVSTRCERLCRTVVRAADPTPSGQCHRGCLAQVFAVGKACEDRLVDWMDCAVAEAAEGDLATRDSMGTARRAHPCARESSAAKDCAKHCQSAGIVQSGEQLVELAGARRRVLYELSYQGCFTCVVQKGAEARAPCSSAKSCASRCFDCRSGQGSVSLRACVAGLCAEPSELDDLVHRLDALGVCSN
jgi:hypothetical protein